MAFTRVQSGNAGGVGGGGGFVGSSLPATLAAPVGSGNCVIGAVEYRAFAATLNSITDNQGNTYTVLDTVTVSSRSRATFVLGNITNGPTVISANFDVADNASIVVEEFSGVIASAGPTDGHTGQEQSLPGTSTDALTSGSVTTTTDGDLIWGVTYDQDGGVVISAGTGFTLGLAHVTPGGDGYFSTEYKTQTTAASVAATFTTSKSGVHDTFVVALKAAPPPVRVPYNPWPQHAPILAQ